jgi:hypothetical protein
MLLGKNKPLDPNKDEQYTPKWIFDKLNVIFDLDVAAPIERKDHVPALNRLTVLDDALTQDWSGMVWMNPPYSKAKPWVEKFLDHGNGIALLPYSKALWMIDMWNKADAICPVYDIKFEQVEGKAQGIFMPVALFALGIQADMILRKAEINKVR